MRERSDRVAVPLVGYGGGVVVSPDVPIMCAYGDDGSTWRAPYGCYDSFWCDPANVWYGDYDSNGHKPCGFGGRDQVSHAWQGKHLGKMLELYRHHSQPYRSPGFYSGYNELVYASNSWNPRLPHTVEAFFYVRGQDWDRNGPTAEKHRQFLRQYGLTTDDVPLLSFDPANFNAPFSAGGGSRSAGGSTHQMVDPGSLHCPLWCATWKCDGAAWCNRGDTPAPCKPCH